MSESNTRTTQTKTWFFTPLAIILPVFVAAAVFYRLDPFKPVHLPVNEINRSPLASPLRNDHMRLGSEEVAKGQVLGPEDFVYDDVKGVVYTSCEDGWIKRVAVNESVVENWVNTGGRPLGLAFDRNGNLIVADAEKVTIFI
ncbi:hypothetical protein TSUD_192480 [Trifolium subterraneum]|uniref:Strictosidine synthase conserved region domain-containing protein n=1 Tax=Trifolium subterraneum TaxID=3900 RepID=A0A2Z6PTI1_TRISU|nr:hypothetical protein TSUD_192480 [Trifolium subterraneum]